HIAEEFSLSVFFDAVSQQVESFLLGSEGNFSVFRVQGIGCIHSEGLCKRISWMVGHIENAVFEYLLDMLLLGGGERRERRADGYIRKLVAFKDLGLQMAYMNAVMIDVYDSGIVSKRFVFYGY